MAEYKSINPAGINSIVNYLSKYNPQRISRYSVSFTGNDPDLPNTTGDGTNANSFFATMVQIPSASIRFFPDSVGAFTPTWKVPLKHEVDDRFIVEFLVDEKHEIRKFIHGWMRSLGLNDNTRAKYGSTWFSTRTPALYVRKMIIQSLNSEGVPSGSNYTLDYVYPKLILPSEFNTDNNDLLRMQVDFNYRSFKLNDVEIITNE